MYYVRTWLMTPGSEPIWKVIYFFSWTFLHHVKKMLFIPRFILHIFPTKDYIYKNYSNVYLCKLFKIHLERGNFLQRKCERFTPWESYFETYHKLFKWNKKIRNVHYTIHIEFSFYSKSNAKTILKPLQLDHDKKIFDVIKFDFWK